MNDIVNWHLVTCSIVERCSISILRICVTKCVLPGSQVDLDESNLYPALGYSEMRSLRLDEYVLYT